MLFRRHCMCVLVAQLYLTPWDLTDCSPPGSSIPVISQARILEWVAFPFSRGSSQPRDWTLVSHIAGAFFTSWATGRPILCIISCISAHLTLMLYSFGCEVTKMQHRVVFVCLFVFTLVLGHLHHTYVDDSQIQISALLMSSSLVFTK